MIRISQLKLNIDHQPEDLERAVREKLGTHFSRIQKLFVVKRSLDARDKRDIHYNYLVDIETEYEDKVLHACSGNRNVQKVEPARYVLPVQGIEQMEGRPYIIGSGPAGLFCAYLLAEYGYRPVVIEQGEPVDDRMKSVAAFWNGSRRLDPFSNIQFGEGGAGTFSDGKLNTGVKDPSGRGRVVLKTFVEHGADEEILYTAKPHLGTDRLCRIIKSMRERILENGGEFYFKTRFIGFQQKDGVLNKISFSVDDNIMSVDCRYLVLAIGHSSRDTFRMLSEEKVRMEAKAFAVGIRVEHLQEEINQAQYGADYKERYKGLLPAADYKLTAQCEDGHGVYSFCMCPGGYVVNASSENGGLCVNGMSYSDRAGTNANAAVVVTVTPEDIGSVNDPMKGVRFQKDLERKAWQAGNGAIPVQRLGDFIDGKVTEEFGKVKPQSKGYTAFADLNQVLPEFICRDIKEGFHSFGRKIRGYSHPDTILSAVESRTSSPVRILRDEHFESSVRGIFPCGEGAGYAGGIMSAAMDGIKVFEEIYSRYRPA